LPDVTAAIINNGVAGQAGFSPGEDPIFRETGDDESIYPYVNLIAASAEEKDNKTFKRIVELYQEEDIAKAVEEDTKGGSYLIKLTQDEIDKVFEDLKNN
jgi:D-methionine transport system substrate-binding protein